MKIFTYSHHQKNLQTGSSLIEVILYIALVSIFISGAIVVGWDLIYGQTKAAVLRNVQSTARFATSRINYEIRNASGINSISANDLCLEMPNAARNPTRIYLNNSQLWIGWGGGNANCVNLTVDQPLTSSDLVVSDVTFFNRSVSPNSANIEYTLTVSSTGSRQEWQASSTYNSSAEMRTP